MLDIYCRHRNGLESEVIRQLADSVNERDEAGSLHPRAPVSALPRRFFRKQENSADPTVLNEFKHQVAEFLSANRITICAQRILVDFHVSPALVPRRYVDATEEVFRLHNQDEKIKEVVIFI